MLTDEQKTIVNRIKDDMTEINRGNTSTCRTYFLDGPRGSGKTMCYNTIISCFWAKDEVVAQSAWTAIAATLLNGGRTVHNLFKLPVPLQENSVCNLKHSSAQAEYLRSVSLFIIDEASMVPSLALEAID